MLQRKCENLANDSAFCEVENHNFWQAQSHVEAFKYEDMAEPRTKEKIYKTDDNTDLLKEKLFELRNVLGRVTLATLFITGE